MIEVNDGNILKRGVVYKVEKMGDADAASYSSHKMAQALRGATWKLYAANNGAAGFDLHQSLLDPDKVLPSKLVLTVPFYVTEVKDDTFIPTQEDFTAQFAK